MTIQIDGTYEQISRHFHVFGVFDMSDKLMYVGVGRMTDIVNFTELVKNPAFIPTEPWSVKVFSSHITEIEARNSTYKVIAVLSPNKEVPEFNKHSYRNRYRSHVICNETGTIYKTASEASHMIGVSSGRMSNHLSRKPGYKTIKGLTYTYTNFIDRDGHLVNK